ncbi:hypothetical protein CFIMG_003298RA [Ceratocystis fimbriata CBS 114723]|uniref:PLD phosphodiesterase domain-containing protein n=1 Tax=Ceratocystis fimbriata CBS 114723 TaxID=1035309 RepID=A0A2C5X0I9_9PEZI|nr:hypothetical protein CFIMG_003298RA [Ceratocystis fimbriata CBS 114723]
MSDNGYSSGEERYQADIRRAIALSARNCPPEPEAPSDRRQGNNRSAFPSGRKERKNVRALPAHVAAALLSANLATPSAMAVSKVSHSSAPPTVNGSSHDANPPIHMESNGISDGTGRMRPPEPIMSQFGSMMLDRRKMEEERRERARLRSTGQPTSLKRNRDEASLCTPIKEEPASQKIKLEPNPRSEIPVGPVATRSFIDVPSDEEELNPCSSIPRKEAITIILDSDSEPDVIPKKEPENKETTAVMATVKPEPKIEEPSHTTSRALPFPRGSVKKTWLRGSLLNDDAISIQEVMQKDDLIMAVVSSFQWDEDFLRQNIDVFRTKLYLVVYADSDEQKQSYEESRPSANIRYIYPPIYRRGIMHSKLMILKFASYLRIVVPTANFVSYDWGYTGAMENHVFLIDLPLRETSPEEVSPGPFQQSLSRFLELSGFPSALVASLDKYDFTEADRYRFVYSAAGSHRGADRDFTGLCGLANAVKSLGLATSNTVELDVVSSSVGKLTTEFLAKIYASCRGYQISDRRIVQNGVAKETPGDLADHFRFYFPSLKTVLGSLQGRGGAGTICLNSKWFNEASFPRKVFRECISVRPRSLMHSKILFVRNKTESGTKAWAYVGSGNLSQSAWGRLNMPKTAEPSMSCDNWECGVVVPIDEEAEQGYGDDIAPLSIFNRQVPVPFKVEEAVAYEGSQLKPWCVW